MRRTIAVILLLAGFSSAPRVTRADDQKKSPDKKNPGEKKTPGDEKAGDAEDQNPLPKILDLMKEAEARLNDADPGEYTQEDQKKIVEAMKFEDKARAALDVLIKKIEHQEGT